MAETRQAEQFQEALTFHRLMAFHPKDLGLLKLRFTEPENRAMVLLAVENALERLDARNENDVYDAFMLGAHLRVLWLSVKRPEKPTGQISKRAIDFAVLEAFLSGFIGRRYADFRPAPAFTHQQAVATGADQFPSILKAIDGLQVH